MHRTWALTRFVAILRKATLAGAAIVLAAASGDAAENVTVRLSFTPFAAHIPVYVAQAKGFYERAGISVQIEPGRGSSFAALTVGSGKEQFGIADPAAVLGARAKGVPLIALANLQQDSGAALFATQSSGITGVEQLKGRNVGMFTGSTTTIFLQALLRKYGLTLDDVKPVTVRSGTDLPLVLDGKIDAEVTIYNNELVAWKLEHPDLKLRIWSVRELGFVTPGNALISNEQLLAAKPQLVADFTRASIAGLEYAIAHPQEAVAIFTAAAPGTKADVEAAKWDAIVQEEKEYPTNKAGFGALDRSKWSALNKLLKDYDVIAAEVDLDSLLKDQTAKR